MSALCQIRPFSAERRLIATTPALMVATREVKVPVADCTEKGCQEEIERALMARDYTRALVTGKVVTLTSIQPDKYRKRVDAYVSVDGRDLGDSLVAAGLGQPYAGGRRAGWCR